MAAGGARERRFGRFEDLSAVAEQRGEGTPRLPLRKLAAERAARTIDAVRRHGVVRYVKDTGARPNGRNSSGRSSPWVSGGGACRQRERTGPPEVRHSRKARTPNNRARDKPHFAHPGRDLHTPLSYLTRSRQRACKPRHQERTCSRQHLPVLAREELVAWRKCVFRDEAERRVPGHRG